MKSKLYIVLSILVIAFLSLSFKDGGERIKMKSDYLNNSLSIEERIEDLLNKI